MTFREQVAEDLSTFLNVDEFADSVDIDGVTVACVLVGNGDTEAPQDGVINRDSLMYLRASDLDPTLVVGQRIVVDGVPMEVIAVDEHQTMLVVRVRKYDS
jgi:hypothetical protein